MRRPIKVGLKFLFVAALAALAFAQSEPKNSEPVLTLKSGTDLVLLDVSLRGKKGLDLSKVPASGWVVLEDGKPQEVKSVSKEELPLAIALVVDVSDSMQPTFDHLQYSARTALDALHANDRVALFAFTTRVLRLTELTTDRKQVADWFKVFRAEGGTNIVDALWAASNYLKAAAPQERCAIVLISDNFSQLSPSHSRRAIEDLLLENQTDLLSIQIINKYPVGSLAAPDPQTGRASPYSGMGSAQPQMPIKVDMEDLIKKTDSSLIRSDAEDIGGALRNALAELRSRYTVGYYASRSEHEPGSFHRVKVTLAPEFGKLGKDYWVRARPGYFTPKADAAAAGTTTSPGSPPAQ